jgi:hypothetical protein
MGEQELLRLLGRARTGRQLHSAWNIYQVPVAITGMKLPDPARLFRNQ